MSKKEKVIDRLMDLQESYDKEYIKMRELISKTKTKKMSKTTVNNYTDLSDEVVLSLVVRAISEERRRVNVTIGDENYLLSSNAANDVRTFSFVSTNTDNLN